MNPLKRIVESWIEQRVLEASQNPIVHINRLCYTFDPRIEPFYVSRQHEIAAEVRPAIDQGYDIDIKECHRLGTSSTVLDMRT